MLRAEREHRRGGVRAIQRAWVPRAALVVTFADGSTDELDLPAGMGDGTDQTARAAAAAAQTAAEAATAAATAQAKADAAAIAAAAAGGGTPPVALYEASAVAIGGSTGLITGNIVCPEAGTIELYFRQETGDRQGSIAFARIPAADLRAAVSALANGYNNDDVNVRIIPLGANRGVSVACQAVTFFLMVSAQSTGNFTVKILHQG